MRRRSLLRRLAAVGSLGAGVVGGCLSREPSATGPRTPPQSPTPRPNGERVLYVDDFQVVEGDDGNLAVPVTVRNEAEERREGTVVVEVTANGDDYRTAEAVSVPAESTTELTLGLDLDYQTFIADGSLTVRVE
ncbi:MAG: hypothetical protein ABEJ79_11580 [Halolamina sp.]